MYHAVLGDVSFTALVGKEKVVTSFVLLLDWLRWLLAPSEPAELGILNFRRICLVYVLRRWWFFYLARLTE